MHENSGLSLWSLGFRAKFTGKCIPKARICQLSKRSVRNYEKLAVGQTVSNFSKKLESFFTRFLASILGDPVSSFPRGTMGFPTKNSPQNVWWREGDLGEFLRIISILHILKIHHTCFHYDHQDISKHSAESTTSLTLRVPNVQIWFQMENCPTSWSLRNHEPPITTLQEIFAICNSHLSPLASTCHQRQNIAMSSIANFFELAQLK